MLKSTSCKNAFRFLPVMLGIVIFLIFPFPSRAETALVSVPRGSLNVRRRPDSKADILFSLPADSRPLVTEEENGWCRVEYEGKTGYARTEYLLIPSHMAGGVYYPDTGIVYYHTEKDLHSPLNGVSSPQTPVIVLETEENWILAQSFGQENAVPGWVDAEQFLHQYREAQETVFMKPENGILACDAPLFAEKEREGLMVVLSTGTAVTVESETGSMALIRSADQMGWTEKSAVALTGFTTESHDLTGALITRDQAREICINALVPPAEAESKDKSPLTPEEYEKAVHEREEAVNALSSRLLFDYTLEKEQDRLLWHCTLSDPEGRLCHALWFRDTENPEIHVFDRTSYAQKMPDTRPELELTLEAENTVLCEKEPLLLRAGMKNACSYEYRILREGELLLTYGPTEQAQTYYLPREKGDYLVSVTARDSMGQSVTQELPFSVTDQPRQGFLLFSQQDQSWDTVPYKDSTLGHSGCAVFSLSHALQLMGKTGEEILPEHLAERYARCLTPDGTDTARLLRESGADLGFSTRKTPYKSEDEIARLLRQGAFFTISVARGHIALVQGLSPDGTHVRVIDSAPSATFERLSGTCLYNESRGGDLYPLERPEEASGLYVCMETGRLSAAEYWMDLAYAARRGCRLILPE